MPVASRADESNSHSQMKSIAKLEKKMKYSKNNTETKNKESSYANNEREKAALANDVRVDGRSEISNGNAQRSKKRQSTNVLEMYLKRKKK